MNFTAPWKGDWKLVISSDLKTITATTTTTSPQFTSLYIAGAKGTVINGQTLADWDIVNTIEVQLDRGKFTLDCKDLTTIAISDKKLSTANWGDWMTGLWSAEIKEANIGQPVDLVGPGNMNFTAPWKGDWKLVLSSDLKTITATTTTTTTNGIEISNAENSVAEYFNLQGVKVAAPANGNVYIVRQGGKVSKQIVK